MRKDTHQQILFITRFAIFMMLEIIICFTPLGSIPIGPIVATLSMIPICIVTIIMGLKPGMLLGALTGVLGIIYWTFIGPAAPTAILFTPFNAFNESASYLSLIISIVPRVLVSVTTYYSYHYLMRLTKQKIAVSAAISGVIGSLTNTILVMGLAYLLLGHTYASLLAIAYQALFGIILTTVLTNGLLEAAISGAVIPFIVKPLILIEHDPNKANS